MGGKVTQTIKEKLGIVQTCTYLTITAKGDDSYGNVTHSIELKNIVEIWSENFQCYALDINGNLYAWGLNDYCQLGTGQFDNYVFPKDDPKYSFVNNLTIINLSRGIISDKIFHEQNPLYLKYIKKISCGDGFTICVDKDGIVYSWGKSTRGQLGYELKYDESTIASGTKCQSSPRIIQSLQERRIHITDVICGSDFTFVMDDQLRPFSWGNNDHYQLGRKTERTMENTPDIAENIAQFEKINKICCGWMHGILLNDKGEVYYWGNPYYDYNKSFKDIADPKKIELKYKTVDIACGFHHFCAIVNDDTSFELFTWGANEYGQCGTKVTKDTKLLLDPVYVEFSENKIMNVFCGAFHTICHLTGDKLYGFGHNYSKEIGDYSASIIDRPVQWGWNIKEPEEYKIKKVLCGNGYTLVVQVPNDSTIFYETEHVPYKKVAVKIEMKDPYRPNDVELITVSQLETEK